MLTLQTVYSGITNLSQKYRTVHPAMHIDNIAAELHADRQTVRRYISDLAAMGVVDYYRLADDVIILTGKEVESNMAA